MGRFDEAIAAFRSSRELDSGEANYTLDLADALTARGQSRVAAGDLLGGRTDLEEARSMRPAFAEYKNNVVDVRLRLGQQWIARGALKTALIELDSARFALPAESDELKRRLAGLYSQLGSRYASRGDNQTAAGTLQKAYDLNGSSNNKRALGSARNTYGLDLMGEQNYADAVTQFQKAVDLFPDNAEYAANLAAAQNALNPPSS
jgi:tetratricopeptide (TPR) repeat protein